jgi:hypothetical protein
VLPTLSLLLHSCRLRDTANRLIRIAHEEVVGLLVNRLCIRGLSTNVAQAYSYRLFHVLVAKQIALLAFADLFCDLAVLGKGAIALALLHSRAGKAKTAPVSVVSQRCGGLNSTRFANWLR